MMEKIEKELIEFISNHILAKGIQLSNETVLKEVGLDSFSIVEIVLFIERKFDVLIPDHKMLPETFISVKNIAQVVVETQQEE